MSQYLLRACLVAGMILVSCGFGAIALTAETAAQVPGVWGGPGVAPPSTPAPPTPPSSSRPLDPRAFYPPPYGPPSNLYPRARFWVPGYYDAYGNWVFGYYRYESPFYYLYSPTGFNPCARVWVPGYYDAYGNWVFGYYRYQC